MYNRYQFIGLAPMPLLNPASRRYDYQHGRPGGRQSDMELLALNGRNYLQLAILIAGTVPSTNRDQSFSAFGNRRMQNESAQQPTSMSRFKRVSTITHNATQCVRRGGR